MGFSSDLKEIRGDHNLGLESQSQTNNLVYSVLPLLLITAYSCVSDRNVASFSWPVLPSDDCDFFRTSYIKVSMKKHGFF